MRLRNKAGVTIHLVMAVILTFMVIVLAAFLGNVKQSISIAASTLLKADYKMESAIILKLQKIKSGESIPAGKLDMSTQEISPGIKLTLTTNRISTNAIRFKAQISGEELNNSILAEAVNNTSNLDPEAWKLFYLQD